MRKNTKASKPNYKTARYWQTLYLYFWFFALAGHYLEVFCAQFYHLLTGSPAWHPIIITVIPLAAPYGLGVMAIIILVVPLVKNQKINAPIAFILSTIIASFVEYFSAVFAAHFFSQYQFWDYSKNLLNLNGYISLQTSLTFGIAAMIFVYWLYPFCQSYLNRLKDGQIRTAFWALAILYAVDLAVSCLGQSALPMTG